LTLIIYGSIFVTFFHTKEFEMSESLKRVSLAVPQSSLDRLEALKTTMGVDDIGQVVSNALRLLEAIVEESEQKSKFFIQRDGKDIAPFEMFSTGT
jgi:hypothetical protein